MFNNQERLKLVMISFILVTLKVLNPLKLKG